MTLFFSWSRCSARERQRFGSKRQTPADGYHSFSSSQLRLARVRGAVNRRRPRTLENEKKRMKLGSVQVLKLNTRVVVKVTHMINCIRIRPKDPRCARPACRFSPSWIVINISKIVCQGDPSIPESQDPGIAIPLTLDSLTYPRKLCHLHTEYTEALPLYLFNG